MPTTSHKPTSEERKAEPTDVKPSLPTSSSRTLNLPTPTGQHHPTTQALHPLIGSPPHEDPFYRIFAHQMPDSRGLPALCLRYQSSEEDDLWEQRERQDDVRAAIEGSLHVLLEQEGVKGENMVVSFDEGPRTPKGALGRIDIVFTSPSAFLLASQNLTEIRIGGDEPHSTPSNVYTLRSYTNTLDGTIFRIDILNLPLQPQQASPTDIDMLFSSLTHMTASIGVLMGIAKVVVATSSNTSKEPEYSGIARCFVKLDRPLIAAPLSTMVTRLPTHMLWNGTPHALLYHGRQLHGVEVYSADYHSTRIGNGGGAADVKASRALADVMNVAAAAAAAAPTEGDGDDSAGGRGNKKRKKGDGEG